ncbi:NTP transferase domain-containing protein [Microbacterium sp. G2-8]|uniref:nucleotidyltransferase family protein n=1 Tax=Microbacterium sp. G2-8 TaxID=2842454 RepID=UPI001C8A7087|nr:NTP transferase domain-containing protein [Microbacterium sp. G2-8]
MRVTGLVLAGGAGTRFGGPKALARADDGTPWIRLAVETLRAGGCDDVVVALGAGAGDARELVPPDARVVVAGDWAKGVAATLRAGLLACTTTAVLDGPRANPRGEGVSGEDCRTPTSDAVVILPVDTPDTPPSAVARVIAAARMTTADSPSERDIARRSSAAGADRRRPASALVQATYGARPGHPVLIGSAHVAALAGAAAGDRGARPYLVAHGVIEVDCADLWSGDDIDRR